jgi:hypothetical protein
MKHIRYEAPTYAVEINDGAYYPGAWRKLDKWLGWERDHRACLLWAARCQDPHIKEEAQRQLWTLYKVNVGKQ